MKLSHLFYECVPQIVPTGIVTDITIKPLFDHVAFITGATYSIVQIPISGNIGQTAHHAWPTFAATPQDGCITCPLKFDSEQEYILHLKQELDGKVKETEFRIYALDADLANRRPYKGDIHLHTMRSDGRESPAFMAAQCRKVGLDFMAITDHFKIEPSQEAIAAYDGVDIDLRMYQGEEVHPPQNTVHMVNFGGQSSVNALFNTEEYRTEVAAVEAELDGIPAGVCRYELASSIWSLRKIREFGGLGVFCHPYWQHGYRLDVPEYLTNLIFEYQPFDALQIGGFLLRDTESHMLQVAKYHDERAKGHLIPIVGATDAHGSIETEPFGWYYTLVFSNSSDLDDLITSVKDLYSISVEAIPNEHARAHGPLRLVRYAQFLLREVFPKHDELCAEEGRLMCEYAAGDSSAARRLSDIKGQVKRLYDRLWATS